MIASVAFDGGLAVGYGPAIVAADCLCPGVSMRSS